MSRTRPTVLVAGMIAADPHQGGATWAVLQYLLGLQELGCKVYFVEPMRAESLTPAGCQVRLSVNAAYFEKVADTFGLVETSALLFTERRKAIGMSYEDLHAVARQCDLLINISGLLTDEFLTSSIPVRVYLDLDPAFNQFWHTQGVDVRFDGHTHYVTIGQNIGQSDCPVPTCGIPWTSTLQPIVLSHWPYIDESPTVPFSTIAHWRSYGSVTHDGVFYGQKAHSFRKIMALPKQTQARFALALGIHAAEVNDLALLADNKWQLLDPAKVVCDPASYRHFIQSSQGELAVAKSGYVLSRCGWFSDRSICYLASGRPVVAEDTAFSRILPTGCGLLSFTTTEEAAAACEDVLAGYASHRSRAREIAVEYFDSRKVLPRLLASIGCEL